MKDFPISADDLVSKLLELSKTETVCFLDSCGVNHLDSHLLIAGVKPIEVLELTEEDPDLTLNALDKRLASQNTASIFTISYDFGPKLESIKQNARKAISDEPDVFLAMFDVLIFHDYTAGKTWLRGEKRKFSEIIELVNSVETEIDALRLLSSTAKSNLTRSEYISKILEIQELIRDGETYQTNLTQRFEVNLAQDTSPQDIFYRLRKTHPAAFAAFLKRQSDYVVSISPERFAQVTDQKITTSPIKGTRPRGATPEKDRRLQEDLITSKKDRAENIMIVDLLRNDIGRVCEFGSLEVENLCDLEVHPTLFHLVSTVSGTLRKNVTFLNIIRAIFPCGSITGCPKIRTMEIIDKIEPSSRGLSMGAIGYSGFNTNLDLSVAIRTIVVKNKVASFNVGGGIVIDSDPESEYQESLTKAKAIFDALGVKN